MSQINNSFSYLGAKKRCNLNVANMTSTRGAQGAQGSQGAQGATGTITFSGPTGSVLYWDGNEVQGSTAFTFDPSGNG
jgi:hypothetical protein